nr:immunoglobulin heavy chain junction region [Macaca mulatta]MOW22595.1 immunoglobulin heavy chain junction region [Macaca mulatta]MOW22709.1 immunoglobulin heavy chain junction region [Macaca mulatta]MOW22767.1 immunoglobulin heavy chain junction region [Macaca mulatta]MOW22769.1 immunoglobulin heavy chain junction region [Macaca mulatta]
CTRAWETPCSDSNCSSTYTWLDVW